MQKRVISVKVLAGLVGALALAVVLGALTADRLNAHGGNASLVHTCIHDKLGVVKVVGAAEGCPAGWTSLDWSVQGPPGTRGATGASGSLGPTGSVGPAGPRGPEGPSGVAAAQGAQGLAGPAGAAGATGAAGSPGPVGLEGPAGAPGATGPEGPPGPAGATGAQGLRGLTGATGAQGLRGITGATGKTGFTGATGATGPQGPAGLGAIAYALIDTNGSVASGTSNVSATWDATVQRYRVTISGEYYIFLNYVTIVTPIGASARTVGTTSFNGKLSVYILDSGGNRIQSRFGFVTYKP